jgi:hypothetical protein
MTKKQKTWVKEFLESPEGITYIKNWLTPMIEKSVDRCVDDIKKTYDLKEDDSGDWWKKGKQII